MKENIRISIFVGISFLISFGILLSFMNIYSEPKEQTNHEKNIFLLGTSYVAAINATHIQHILDEKHISAKVYKPKSNEIISTLDNIDYIISNKPRLVIYGVGFRDIGFLDDKQCTFSYIKKYEIKHETQDTKNSTNQLIIFNQNPKYMTISILSNLFDFEYFIKNKDEINAKIELTDFKANDIRLITELNKIDPQHYCMDFDFRDKALTNLDKIFTRLKASNIDVIVFIPPYTKAYLDRITPSLRSDLTHNIKTISETHGFIFIDFSSRYENYNIFSDHTHIAHNQKSLIYSNEIASLIISKLTLK